jgi:phage head maturation protease
VEIDLWEVSLVTFPMLPTARAQFDSPVMAHDDIASALAAALGGRP